MQLQLSCSGESVTRCTLLVAEVHEVQNFVVGVSDGNGKSQRRRILFSGESGVSLELCGSSRLVLPGCRPDSCRLCLGAPPCSVFEPRRRLNFERSFPFFFTLNSHHKSTGIDTPHLPSVILRARESGSRSPLLPSGLEPAASMARVCRRGFPTFLHHEPDVFGDMLQAAAAG